MKKYTILILVTLICSTGTGVNAQPARTWYIAAASGLNLREAATTDSKVLVKIPYGTRFEFPAVYETTNETTVEGFTGEWSVVVHEGHGGCMFMGFCLPVPPPDKPGEITLDEYLARTYGFIFGPKEFDHSALAGAMDIREVSLYNNGAIREDYDGYEYNSTTWHLPGISLQQAFLLCRLLKWDNGLLTADTPFPLSSYTDDKKSVVVERIGSVISRIRIDAKEGEWFFMEFLYLEEKAVVIAGSRI